MAGKQTSTAVIGIGIGLVVVGVLVALFGSIVYGVVLVACGAFLPAFVRRSSE